MFNDDEAPVTREGSGECLSGAKENAQEQEEVVQTPILETGRCDNLAPTTPIEKPSNGKQTEGYTSNEEKELLRNLLSMSPILSSLYLTLKKEVTGPEITLQEAVIRQLRQGVSVDQINLWLKDVLNSYMSYMAADRTRVQQIPNIELLGEEFLNWLGFGPGHFTPGSLEPDVLEVDVGKSPLLLTKRPTVTEGAGPPKKLKSFSAATDQRDAPLLEGLGESGPGVFSLGSGPGGSPNVKKHRSWKSSARNKNRKLLIEPLNDAECAEGKDTVKGQGTTTGALLPHVVGQSGQPHHEQ